MLRYSLRTVFVFLVGLYRPCDLIKNEYTFLFITQLGRFPEWLRRVLFGVFCMRNTDAISDATCSAI